MQRGFFLIIPLSSKTAWGLSEMWQVHIYQRTFVTITKKLFFQKLKNWLSFPCSPLNDDHVQLLLVKTYFLTKRKTGKKGLSGSLCALFTVMRGKWFVTAIIISLLRRAVLITSFKLFFSLYKLLVNLNWSIFSNFVPS